MTSRLLAQSIIVFGIALCGLAHADPKKPDAAAIKKANNHFKLGQEFFKSGQWDRAITEYQAALDLTGEPLMIFNLALAHDRAGRPEQALALYLKYLEQGPDSAIADEARGFVAKLTPVVDKLRAERADAAARKAAADKQAREAADKRANAAKDSDAARRHKEQNVGRAASLEMTGKLERWSGLALVGVGLVVVGYGAKRGLDAGSIADELSAHEGGWTDADIARDQEGRDAGKQMVIYTTIGGIVTIGGGVLYLLGRSAGSRAERLRVGAMPARGGATASLTLRF